ncbi:MAG: AAA family ATPase [Parvibaculaceae bacterium]
MKRVLVIGPSGAGKSTFAAGLAQKTGLPLIHLDTEYWNPGWVPTPDEDWLPRVEELAARDSWIMEGNYSSTFPVRMPRADTIFLVIRPRWLCLARALWRSTKHFGRTRPDLAPGCPERYNLEFLKWVWDFERRSLPYVREAMATLGAHADHVTIATDREGERFLKRLRAAN